MDKTKIKKVGLYLVVGLVVILFIFIFLKIFAFNKPQKVVEEKIEITEELIDKLYSYLPINKEYNGATMYSSSYTSAGNINYSLMSNMILEYIKKYDSFKLENATKNEINTSNDVLYKIKKDEFLKDAKIIFDKEAQYKLESFIIDEGNEAILRNDYVYVSKDQKDYNDEYITFKDKVSYTVADNNQTIKIYDYYLKCRKSDGICYNDDLVKEVNINIKYRENFNIKDYTDYLKQYVHVFKYDLDTKNFYWNNSEIAKEES